MFALRCDSREGIWVGELIFVDRWSLGKWQEASCLTSLGPVTTSCRLQVHMNNIHVTYIQVQLWLEQGVTVTFSWWGSCRRRLEGQLPFLCCLRCWAKAAPRARRVNCWLD